MPELDFDGCVRELSNFSGELVTVGIGGSDEDPPGAIYTYGLLDGPRFEGADVVYFHLTDHPSPSVLRLDRAHFEGADRSDEGVIAAVGSLMIYVDRPSEEERANWEAAMEDKGE